MFEPIKARLDEIAERWVTQTRLRDPSTVPDVVYHYTDANGLVGTLQSHKLWLTDIRYLNDKSELTHTRNMMLNYLSKIVDVATDDHHKSFLNALHRYQSIESSDESFIYSTSERKDDLSQWRGYANDGFGFTIGLSGKFLCDLAHKPDTSFSFAPVEYKSRKQTAQLADVISEFRDSLDRFISQYPEDVKEISNNVAYSADYVAENMGAWNKHSSFEAEQEWRIVTYIPEEDRKDEIKVRARGAHLVPYHEIQMGDKLPILEIGVGPGFTDSGELLAVERLCGQTGYHVEVYAADTPYRRS